MQAKQRVSAEEMNQLTEAGVPAWELLAATIGTTVPNAMKLAESKAIPASRAIGGLVDGLRKRYGGLMSEQSRSIAGLVSTTKDLAFGQRGLFGRFGEYASDALHLQDRLSGFNTTLEDMLRSVERGGFGALWDKIAPPGAEPALAALGGALSGIAGYGVYKGIAALVPKLWGLATVLGPVAGYGALFALAAYDIYNGVPLAASAIDKLADAYANYWATIEATRTGTKKEDVLRSFGLLTAPRSGLESAAAAKAAGAASQAEANAALAANDQALIDVLLGKGPATTPLGSSDIYVGGNAARTAPALQKPADTYAGMGTGPVTIDTLLKRIQDAGDKIREEAEKTQALADKAMAAPGFAAGGPTANVPPHRSAGLIEVHGQEWIMPAWMAKQNPMLVAALEAMRKSGGVRPDFGELPFPGFAAGGSVSQPGFAGGGPVAMPALAAPSVNAGGLLAAGKAMERFAALVKAANKESQRATDLFMIDRAREATRTYQLTGSGISESLMRARDSGSDSMWNLGTVIANSSRLARDSAVQDLGNIGAAASDLSGSIKPIGIGVEVDTSALEEAASKAQAIVERTYTLKLDSEGAIAALQAIQAEAEGREWMLKLRLPEVDQVGFQGRMQSVIDEVQKNTVFKLQIRADSMTLKTDALETAAAKTKEATDNIRLNIGNMTIGTISQWDAWNIALVAALAGTVPQLLDKTTAIGAGMAQMAAATETAAIKVASDLVLNADLGKAALQGLGDRFGKLKENVSGVPYVFRSASEGGLEALQLLANQGANAIGVLQKGFVDFLPDLLEGKKDWADYGNTMLDVARKAIVNAEAQLISAKAVAIGQAIAKAIPTGGASLLAIPAILLQAAAGMAALELAKKLIPEAPKAALGGIVPARPGGTNVLVGEAGQPEVILPLDRLNRYMTDSTAAQIRANEASVAALRAMLPKNELPKLAAGGIVMPQPGGVNVTVAERNRPEIIAPLDRLSNYFADVPPLGQYGTRGQGGRAGGNITLEFHYHGEARNRDDVDDFMDQVVRRLKREGVVISG